MKQKALLLFVVLLISQHSVYWTERDANNKANDYFQKRGYITFWPFGSYYPL